MPLHALSISYSLIWSPKENILRSVIMKCLAVQLSPFYCCFFFPDILLSICFQTPLIYILLLMWGSFKPTQNNGKDYSSLYFIFKYKFQSWIIARIPQISSTFNFLENVIFIIATNNKFSNTCSDACHTTVRAG
jgi:hypothetical protein